MTKVIPMSVEEWMQHDDIRTRADRVVKKSLYGVKKCKAKEVLNEAEIRSEMSLKRLMGTPWLVDIIQAAVDRLVVEKLKEIFINT